MKRKVKVIVQELFPYGNFGTSRNFVDAGLRLPQQESNVRALEVAVNSSEDKPLLRELRDIAVQKRADEDVRQASIIARAQALFVAVALFGLLITFGAGIMTNDIRPPLLQIIIVAGLSMYILSQLIIMMVNTLKTVGGVSYPTAGSSDLAKWISLPSEEEFYRHQTLLTLSHYRWAALNNSWRFQYLDQALRSFRNIVFSVGVLIITIFVLIFVSSERAKDPLFVIFS